MPMSRDEQRIYANIMKNLIIYLCSLACVVSSQAAPGDTPERLITFALEKDSRPWSPEQPGTNITGVVIEWALKGQPIASWKELVDERLLLTRRSVRQHVNGWKSMLAQVDPKAEVKEEENSDGSITVTYDSVKADEMGISRHFKGPAGIYVLSYRVRS